MQLTEDERAALDKHRARRESYPDHDEPTNRYRLQADEAVTIADMALRLFPVRTYGDLVIRWDDEITPERLVACGFKQGSVSLGCFGVSYYPIERRWFSGGTLIPVAMRPRSMGDVWQLMERFWHGQSE